MKRFGGFFLGVLTGAALMFGSLKYHFLYTKDGLKAVPKQTATFSETLLDVREFGPSDWVDHPAVMAAVVKADESELLEAATVDSLRNSVDRWVEEFRGEGSK
ncbi:MAG: hypothetical protein SGJ19_16970 [Planctomycetia bacterium]|nr:hypothetical protein [Planctomycetia bacterium]